MIEVGAVDALDIKAVSPSTGFLIDQISLFIILYISNGSFI